MNDKDKEKQGQAPINVWGIANIGCTMENVTFQTLVASEGTKTEEVDVVEEAPIESSEDIDASEEDKVPELNLATPRIVMQNMLKAEKVRPVFNNPKKYTKEWIDQFVASLMASEHGAYIAKKWEETDQRKLLKGYIFGLLKEANVLKGSRLSIARAHLGISEKSKVPELVKQVNTFASYMSKSRWKNEPYADWVLEYVGEAQEEA